MVVSFKLSRRGRRFYPPPPPATATTAADDDPPPPAASPGWSSLPPPPPWDVAAGRLGSSVPARSDVPEGNATDPVELDLEPSFALNLFPDGYSIGELDKGMLLFLIGDDPERKPYNRASKALLSDIEYGCLPPDILPGIPCKFQNGTVVCEVRDYRSFLSNGGEDFPKMNRVALRLGTECVVKDLSSIADASWTYHDQLIAESTIINSLQPRLNLDPTPCLEKLCNYVVKKIDLGLNKGRQRTKDTSLLNNSTDPPEKCKPKECGTCEGAAVCVENSALEVLPTEILNSAPLNCPSSPQVNNAKSISVSGPENTIQRSSTLRSSSALCDRKQSASSPAPDHFLRSHVQRAEVASVQVDYKNGRSLRETVLPQKRKESSNLPCERWPSSKSGRLNSRSSKGQFQKSMGISNKEGLKLGSPKELLVEVKIDQTTGNKDMRVQQQKPFSMVPTKRPLPSLNRNNPCLEKYPEKVKLGSRKELTVEVKVEQAMGKKDMRGQKQKPFSVIPTNRPIPSSNRNNPCLEKFPEKVKLGSRKELPVEVKVDWMIGKKDMRGQKHEPLSMLPTNCPYASLNRNSLHVEKTSEKVHSSLIRMKGRHQVSIVDLDNHGLAELEDSATSVTSCSASSRKAADKPHEDKASTEQRQPTTSKRHFSGTSTISPNQQINFKGKRQKKADIQVKQPREERSTVEPGVTDGTSSQLGICPDIELCIEHPLYTIEPDIEKILSEVILTTQRHGLNGNAAKIDGVETLRSLSSCSPSHFFRYESADGSPYMREEIMSCYPSGRTKNTRNIKRLVFHRVQYFCRGIVDQSHYILCLLESEAPDDHQIAVETIFGHEHIHIATFPTSDHANKFMDQFILLMKRDGYRLCNAAVCNGSSELRQQFEDVSWPGYLTREYPQYQGFSPCVAKSVVINESKDTGLAFQKRLLDVHANVLEQGSQQSWLPDVHANVLHRGSQQCELPNVLEQGSQQLWLPDVHANVLHQESQQWGLPDVHANVLHQGSQQWGLPDVYTNVLHQGSQQWGLPDVHANVLHQGSQQWGLPDVHANVLHQGSQQWGLPDVHANVLHQVSQQWGQPDVHANVLHQGIQQWVLTEQSPTLATVDTSHFLNPSYPIEQQYNSRVLQDQRLSFASGVCSLDLDQYLYVQPSPEADMDQFFQSRHDLPGFIERYATSMSTGSYNQWHQIPPQLDSRMYQWDFQDFGRQINNLPPMHSGRSMLLSPSHRVGSPQMSSPITGSNDGSVTSAPVHLSVPLSYQYLSHGIC